MAIVHAPFGDQIPFCDPAWYQGAATPYYKDTHVAFRAKVRAFVEKEIIPFTSEWEQKGEYPQELHRKCYEAGIYGSVWPKEYGGTPPADYDTFHELILYDEMGRCATNGLTAGLLLVMGIGLPPVLNFGSEYLKQKVARDVITAQKFICLAITEPFAGSDVASIQTTAKKEGEFYVVNGQKKFISGGHWADFFVTAVRTGGPGMGGISLLVIEKDMPGITIRRLPTQGWLTSHTTHIVFEDVKVPLKNLIGQENQGFKIIMTNFNHERLVGITKTVRNCRVCLEEAIKYARLRKTFGKPLIQQQVIRHKLGKMIYLIESLHAQQEFITFQIAKGIDNNQVASAIALAKVQATRALEKCAREASQIFGGNSFLRSGPGEKVERIYREVRVAAIGGGSEEVMLDLGVKQARL